jgi:CRP-like cAMP-binding protein
MGFLDQGTRSSDAIAVRETELYALARSRFEKLVEQHRVLGLNLVEGLARTLSLRLRHANKELRSFHES